MNPIQQQRALMHALSEPVNARSHLATIIRSRLDQWLYEREPPPGSDKKAAERCAGVLAVYADCLSRLEGKTCARSKAAREQIRAARDPIAEKLELVESLQVDLSGPLALELQARVTATRSNLKTALAARELAT